MQEMLANPAVQGGLAPFAAALIVAALLSPFPLGAGTGAAAILGASLTYGLYGFAVAAASGAFLLVQMITGRKTHAGATFLLAATVVTMLLAAATMILAQLPWYAVLALAFVPVAASLPLRAGAPVWLQAVLLSFLGLVVAGIACALAWQAGG